MTEAPRRGGAPPRSSALIDWRSHVTLHQDPACRRRFWVVASHARCNIAKILGPATLAWLGSSARRARLCCQPNARSCHFLDGFGQHGLLHCRFLPRYSGHVHENGYDGSHGRATGSKSTAWSRTDCSFCAGQG